MNRTAATIVMILALLSPSRASADPSLEHDPQCGATPTRLTKGPGTESARRPQVATDSYVEARIVFVGFPNHAQALPVWADSMAAELSDYITTMSRGAQTLHVSVLRRTDIPGNAWVADSVAAHYVNYGFGTLNTEIMNKIANQQSGVWTGVEMVFMVHYQCTFPCNPADPSNESSCEFNCYYGGIDDLELTGSVPGFSGYGTTTRFYYPLVDDPFNHHAQLNFAAHEYGHVMGLWHSPGSDNADANFANMGRYDIMRSGLHAYCQRGDGLIPYGAPQLVTLGWLPSTLVTTDTRNLHIPDCRAANATAIRVNIPNASPAQYFLLENHRSGSAYDAKLAGTGLVIWHSASQSPFNGFWDVESAVGKFTNGQPDAVAGKDSLELNLDYCGSGNDLWDGVNKTNFSVTTNPNTNAYDYPASNISAHQSTGTDIGFENIRRDPNSTDMIVDVYVTPKQYVTAPNGGETFTVGAPVSIQWQTRPYASIANVDVQVSGNAGSSWTTLASAIANSGSYSWTPTSTGSQYRVRVVSHATDSNVGSDDSDANFTVTVSGHWVALPSSGSSRRQAAATFDTARQRTLVFGGTNGTVNFNDVLTLGNSDTWSSLSTSGTPPSARRRAGMIYDVSRDRVVLFGGYSSPNSLFSQLNDLWQLNLSNNTWSSISAGSPPSPITYETQAVYDPTRDRLLVVEGTGIVWAYPLAGGSWSILSYGGLGNAGAYHFSAAYDSLKDEVVVFGGWIDGPDPNLDNMNGVSVFPLSGPNANLWQNSAATGTAPSARALSSLIYESARDRAVAFGGEQFQTQANTHYNDAWQIGLANPPAWWQLSPAGTGPGLRSQHVATYDRRFDRMIVATGTDGTNLYSDAWALSWDQVAPAQVTDLSPTVECQDIMFTWTVPGDDGAVGQSIAYDLRRSSSVITEGTWGSATTVATGSCSPVGTNQDAPIVTLGACSAKYYYAVKVRDDGYNWSPLSNVTSKIGTPCPHPPAQCYDYATTINTAPKSMELGIVGANPSTEPVDISFGVPARLAGASYQLAIYDIAGRRVQSLGQGVARVGRGSVSWNLTNTTGARVAAGVYYLRFTLGAQTMTRTVVTLR